MGQSLRRRPLFLYPSGMVKLNSLKVDPVRQTEGIWFPWEQGVELKIARLGNPKFDARLRELVEEAKERGQKEPDAEAATVAAMAETVLTGWKGIEGEDGKPWRYTPQRALELLTDESLGDLYKFVLMKAAESAHFRMVEDQEAVGN